MNASIQIVRDHSSFLSLSKGWNRLSESSNSPLLNFEWFYHCWEFFHAKDELHIIILKVCTEVKAIAPLVLVDVQYVKQLEIIGISRMYEPSDFLFADIESLKQLLNFIGKQGYPLLAKRVPEYSAIAGPYKRILQSRGIAISRFTSKSQLVKIKGTWEDYYHSLSSQRRYDHRRALRRAEKLGGLSFDIVSPGPDQVKFYLRRFLEVENSGWKGRWKGRSYSSLDKQNEYLAFFTEYVLAASRKGILKFYILRINGGDAAVQIAVEKGGCLWVLKIAYQEKWNRCSPGIILTMMSIKHAFNADLDAYEFLGSEESWVSVWANQSHRYLTIYFFPYSWRGVWGGLIKVMAFLWKKITKHFERRL